MRILWIAVGGALGSVARYGLAGLVHRFVPPVFPYGTFVVNVVGCLAFGFIVGLADERFAIGTTARTFLLIGVCGGFTTFSTFTYETFELLRDSEFVLALTNGAGQLLLGLAGLWAGYGISRVI